MRGSASATVGDLTSYLGMNPAPWRAMRDIRLFILGHLALVAVAVLGSL